MMIIGRTHSEMFSREFSRGGISTLRLILLTFRPVYPLILSNLPTKTSPWRIMAEYIAVPLDLSSLCFLFPQYIFQAYCCLQPSHAVPPLHFSSQLQFHRDILMHLISSFPSVSSCSSSFPHFFPVNVTNPFLAKLPTVTGAATKWLILSPKAFASWHS